jgi:hypothetical protein
MPLAIASHADVESVSICRAAAIIELARDPRYVGGTVAVLAVLHTWTQQLNLESVCSWHAPSGETEIVPILRRG